jgi:pantetheine-phosphate adenylyltransferase
MGRAVYPGTFDPMTYGHLDVIKRGALIFDELIVAVSGTSVTKSCLFSETERLAFLQRHTMNMPNVRVEVFNSLAVDYVRSLGMKVLLRGIRTASDFEYEYQMAITNRKLASDVETVFVMASLEYSYVSAKLIREIMSVGGSVSAFVPADVETALKAKFVRPRAQ